MRFDVIGIPRPLFEGAALQSFKKAFDPFGRITFDLTELGSIDVQGVGNIHIPSNTDLFPGSLREGFGDFLH